MRETSGLTVFLSLSAIFAGCTLAILSGAGLHLNTDTALYREIAGQDLSVAWFTTNRRPPLYPLIIRLCGGNLRLVMAGQIIAYLGAWMLLARLFQRGLSAAGRPRAGAVMVGITYYLALYPDFAGWNHVILTESLSISAQVAMMMLLTRLMLHGQARDAILLACLSVACVMLRDAEAAMALALVVPLCIAGLRAQVNRVALMAAACLMVGGAAASNWSADRAGGGQIDAGCSSHGAPAFAPRWVFPLLNIIGRRILPDPEAARFFQAHGMPLDATLRSMSGAFAFGGATLWQFYCDPALQPFRTWLLAHGKSTYVRYLLTHPAVDARTLWQDRADLFQADGYRLSPYPDTRFAPDTPAAARLVYDDALPPRLPLILAYAVAAAASMALLLVGRLHRRADSAGAGLVCASLVVVLLWLAAAFDLSDSTETARHAVLVPLQAVLTALLGTFFLLQQRRSKSFLVLFFKKGLLAFLRPKNPL